MSLAFLGFELHTSKLLKNDQNILQSSELLEKRNRKALHHQLNRDLIIRIEKKMQDD